MYILCIYIYTLYIYIYTMRVYNYLYMFVPICDWFKTITPGYTHTSLLVSTCSVKVASNMLRIISALFETNETERPSSTSETDGDTVTKGPAMKVLLTWGCSLSRNVLQHRWDHHYRWKRIIPRPAKQDVQYFFRALNMVTL